MIDVCFIDRVRGGIGVHDVLKGGVIKGECLTWLCVVQIIALGGGGDMGCKLLPDPLGIHIVKVFSDNGLNPCH